MNRSFTTTDRSAGACAVPQEPESLTNNTTLSEYLESLLVTVILASRHSFVVKLQDSFSSMERPPRSDHLLVNKFILAAAATGTKASSIRDLQRGDIIVFKFLIRIIRIS